MRFVFDYAQALAARFCEGVIALSHPHWVDKYFLDADGNEWEIVENLGDDPAQQNGYLL